MSHSTRRRTLGPAHVSLHPTASYDTVFRESLTECFGSGNGQTDTDDDTGYAAMLGAHESQVARLRQSPQIASIVDALKGLKSTEAPLLME